VRPVDSADGNDLGEPIAKHSFAPLPYHSEKRGPSDIGFGDPIGSSMFGSALRR
jgi:hypothetical protein